MKRFTAGILALVLPLTMSVTMYAEEIPDGFSFNVEIVGGYSPPHTTPKQQAPTKTTEERKDTSDFEYTLEEFFEEFTKETNLIREENGLPAFETDDLLTTMAQARIDESTKINHVRPDASDPTTIFPEYGSDLRCTGENIQGAGSAPRSAARGFMQTSHRENILNPDAKYMGVGVKWVDTIVGPRIGVLQLFATDE